MELIARVAKPGLNDIDDDIIIKEEKIFECDNELDDLFNNEDFIRGRNSMAEEAGKIFALKEVGLSAEEALNYIFTLRALSQEEEEIII